MKQYLEYLWILFGFILIIFGRVIESSNINEIFIYGISTKFILLQLTHIIAILSIGYGLYRVTVNLSRKYTQDKSRKYDIVNILRLLFLISISIAIFGVITGRWLDVLFSLGVVGFAITFALQQPLFSLIGWAYILAKRPYRVGDRVAIEGSKGDVIDIDILVTTLWEINGELVSSNQPSGRVITLPNSVVLSSHVYNYTSQYFPFMWNEISIQVAYETDLDFVTNLLEDIGNELLGDLMEKRVEIYRQRLSETPVELEVKKRPQVNIQQKESWIELKLRYIVHPRQGQRTKNELYKNILKEFKNHPEKIKFPKGRKR